MALIECRHRDKEEITTFGESRRRFICADCSEISLGPDPETCIHRDLKRIEAASMNQWQCEACWTLLTFGDPEMTGAGLAFYGLPPKPQSPQAG